VLRYPAREWIARCEALTGLRFLPVDSAIGVRSVELPGLHADPADHLIVASAERLGAMLVTKDERLRAYGGISTLWS
jgi:PIN domain nuclease of toxin-antitoxin system